MSPTTIARRAGLFTVHQLAVLAGILLFPVALASSRAGSLLGRLLARVHEAYDRAA